MVSFARDLLYEDFDEWWKEGFGMEGWTMEEMDGMEWTGMEGGNGGMEEELKYELYYQSHDVNLCRWRNGGMDGMEWTIEMEGMKISELWNGGRRNGNGAHFFHINIFVSSLYI